MPLNSETFVCQLIYWCEIIQFHTNFEIFVCETFEFQSTLQAFRRECESGRENGKISSIRKEFCWNVNIECFESFNACAFMSQYQLLQFLSKGPINSMAFANVLVNIIASTCHKLSFSKISPLFSITRAHFRSILDALQNITLIRGIPHIFTRI